MKIKTIKNNDKMLFKNVLRCLFLGFALSIAMFSEVSFSYIYQCEKNDTKCVVSYNNDLKKNAGEKPVKEFSVTMPKSKVTDTSEIKSK